MEMNKKIEELEKEHNELEKAYNELGRKIEQLKNKETDDWFPEYGENYYTPRQSYVENWDSSSKTVTKFHQVTCGIAKTEEGAVGLQQKIYKKIKIIDRWKELNGDWKPDFTNDEKKFCLHYAHKDKKVDIYTWHNVQVSKYAAKSEEVLETLIEEFGEWEVCEALGVV